jgi:hypothetical protein
MWCIDVLHVVYCCISVGSSWKDAPFTSHEWSSDMPEFILGVKVLIFHRF